MKFNYLDLAMLIGVAIGLSFSALLFFTVPWYHNMLIWSWTHPIMWVIGIAGGFCLGAYDKHLNGEL